MADYFDDLLDDLLRTVQPDVDRVMRKMIQAPYRGKVPFNHLKNMDPEDFERLSSNHVETIQWFRKHPSKFILFEGDDHRVKMIGVRIPSAKICLRYLSPDGCTDSECYRYHVCRKYIGGSCSVGPSCPHDHHFQSEHNKSLLQKQKLDSFIEEDLQTIFASSHLRVCDIYNQSSVCSYGDRCSRIHLCENFVRGMCTSANCKLSHTVDSPEHSKRLLRLYALDDKSPEEIVQNLLITRRRQSAAAAGSSVDAKRSKLKQLFEELYMSEAKHNLLGEETSEATGLSSVGNTVRVSPVQTTVHQHPDSDDNNETDATRPSSTEMQNNASWQLQLFDEWKQLNQTASRSVEKKFCDPNEDIAAVKTHVEHFDSDMSVTINFIKMTAMLYDNDTQIYDDIKVMRQDINGTPWLWYWEQDDNTWQQYTPDESTSLEASYQKKVPSVYVGKNLAYRIKFSDMTQSNRKTGRVRRVRRRPALVRN